MTYDSTHDTLKHIRRVQELLIDAGLNLNWRGIVHDESKLEEPEKGMFDRATERLRGLTYGSDEYKASLKDLGPALRHHYLHNSHHPEHHCLMELEPVGTYDADGTFHPETHTEIEVTIIDDLVSSGHGIASMSLMDITEMLIDWKAASERHENGNIYTSIEINAKRFGMSDQLKSIFVNTAKEFGW